MSAGSRRAEEQREDWHEQLTKARMKMLERLFLEMNERRLKRADSGSSPARKEEEY